MKNILRGYAFLLSLAIVTFVGIFGFTHWPLVTGCIIGFGFLTLTAYLVGGTFEIYETMKKVDY